MGNGPARGKFALSKSPRYMKKLLTVFTATTLLFGACKKKDQPDPNPSPTPTPSGKYLTKVNYWTVSSNTEVTIRAIEVNSSGDIMAINTFSTANKPLLKLTTFSKDGNGRIATVEGKFQDTGARKWQFDYDATGNVVKTTYTASGMVTTYTYAYDSDNRLTKEETSEVDKPTSIVSRTTYTYSGTSKNPATSKHESLTFSPVMVTESSFTFDGKKNPYSSLGSNSKMLYYLDMGEFFTENVSEEKVKDGSTYTNTHQYNSDNYAISTDGGKGSGLKFYYQ